MKRFEIPVTWRVWDKINVEAETLQDAIKIAKDNIDTIQVSTEPEYVYDSIEVEDDWIVDGEERLPDSMRVCDGQLEFVWDYNSEEIKGE